MAPKSRAKACEGLQNVLQRGVSQRRALCLSLSLCLLCLDSSPFPTTSYQLSVFLPNGTTSSDSLADSKSSSTCMLLCSLRLSFPRAPPCSTCHLFLPLDAGRSMALGFPHLPLHEVPVMLRCVALRPFNEPTRMWSRSRAEQSRAEQRAKGARTARRGRTLD